MQANTGDVSTRAQENSAQVCAVRVSAAEWDALLPELSGSTFFDTSQWQEAFRGKVNDIHYVHFIYKNAVIAGFSSGVLCEDGAMHFLSPFTAAFGGVLSVPHLKLSLWIETIRALKWYCASVASSMARHSIRYIRRSRLIMGKCPQEAEDFALVNNGFCLQAFSCDLFFDLSNQLVLKKNLASALRKIEREKTFKFCSCGIDEYVIFRKNIVATQQKRITVPDEEILSGKKLFPNNMLCYKAVDQSNKTIAVLLEDMLHPHCSIGRSWYVNKEANIQNGTLFIVHEWLECLRQRGILLAGFGSSAITGKPVNEPVVFFKERFFPLLHDAKKTYNYQG